MDVITALRDRRTSKEFAPDPVDRPTLERLFAAARWAPCHRMTQPWRFRVLGPEALTRLKVAAGEAAVKLDRAPTLVVASFAPSPLPLHATEDEHAAACAVYALLLAAHAEGLASYWRTPGVLRAPEGRAAVSVPETERILGLIHLGHPAGAPPEPPARRDAAEFVTYLD